MVLPLLLFAGLLPQPAGAGPGIVDEPKAKGKALGKYRIEIPEIDRGRKALDSELFRKLKKPNFQPLPTDPAPEPENPGIAPPAVPPGEVQAPPPSESIPMAGDPSAPSVADSFKGVQPQAAPGLTQGAPVGGRGWDADVEGLLQSAEENIKLKQPREALLDVNEALKAAPRSPRAYELRSEALTRMESYVQAEADARKAIACGGREGSYQALSWTLLHQGRYGEAISAASTALKFNIRSATAFALRAFSHEGRGDRENMVADLRQAAALEPARFSHVLEKAAAGKRVFDPADPERWHLLDAAALRFKEGGRGGIPVLTLLAGLLGLAAAGFAVHRRRQKASPKPVVLAPGTVLADKFELKEPLGADSWKAEDRNLKRMVVLWRAAGRDGMPEHAQSLASLRHTNIEEFFEALDLEAGFFLVFEFMEGKTLKTLLAEGKKLSLAQAVQLFKPVCSALEFMHARGAAHGGVRLSSIMLTEFGYVKLLDMQPPGGTTPAPASDIISLGNCLQEAVGAPSPALDAVLRQALDPDPMRRFRTVGAFAAALERVAANGG